MKRSTKVLAAASAGALIPLSAAFFAAPAFAQQPPNVPANVNGSVVIVATPTLTMSLDHTSFTLSSGDAGSLSTAGTVSGPVSGPTVSAPINATVSDTALVGPPSGFQVTFAATSDFAGAVHGGSFPASDLSVFNGENPNSASGAANARAFDWSPVHEPGTAVQVEQNSAAADPANDSEQVPFAFEIESASDPFAPQPPISGQYTGGLPNVPADTYSMAATITAIAGS